MRGNPRLMTPPPHSQFLCRNWHCSRSRVSSGQLTGVVGDGESTGCGSATYFSGTCPLLNHFKSLEECRISTNAQFYISNTYMHAQTCILCNFTVHEYQHSYKAIFSVSSEFIYIIVQCSTTKICQGSRQCFSGVGTGGGGGQGGLAPPIIRLHVIV